MSFWTDVLAFCEFTTERVGERLLCDFGTVLASRKADGSLVTRSDTWADQALREAIASTFPDHGVLTEECEHVFQDKEWCWIVDPIDGTTNFTRGVPMWATSLGLLYRGTPVFGYVHVPPVRQTFHGYWSGSTGLDMSRGAYCNGEPIRSSAEALSDHQFISLCSRSSRVLRHALPCKVRMLGAATYNLLGVASGAMLGAIEKTPKIWDVAGVWAIVQAAGGIWINLGRDPQFPLEPGRDYGARSYPTLALASNDLRSHLEPLVRSAFGGETSPSP